jgi:hypothetical protein
MSEAAELKMWERHFLRTRRVTNGWHENTAATYPIQRISGGRQEIGPALAAFCPPPERSAGQERAWKAAESAASDETDRREPADA